MATKVLMEALSPTMEEGRLVEWKKAEGEAVSQGDVLAEVETDKAVMELVARADGVLLKRLIGDGETVAVASVIGWIGKEGESVPPADKKDERKEQRKDESKEQRQDESKEQPEDQSEEQPEDEEPRGPVPVAASRKAGRGDGAKPSARVKASPLARRLAQERGLDLGLIEGSGPEGRIIKRDIETAAARPAAKIAGGEGPAYEDVPLSQVRKTIARRLAQSLGPIPTFYLTTEADMERAAEARELLKAEFGEEGKVSFNDIVLKAVATALRQHRACNGWWQDDHIRYWNEIHLGMAVAIPDGLITPVIRDADRKSLRQLAAEARSLAERARNRKLAPAEYTGATFSVSNLGMFDIDEFTAVINPPEAGILAVGRMTPTPVVHHGEVAVRRRMRLTMSCDHRVIDGATGADFLRTLKRMLENPLALVW